MHGGQPPRYETPAGVKTTAGPALADPETRKLVKEVLEECKNWKQQPSEEQMRDFEPQIYTLLAAFAVVAQGPGGHGYDDAIHRLLEIKRPALVYSVFSKTMKERTVDEYINILDAVFESHVLNWQTIPIPRKMFLTSRLPVVKYAEALIRLNTSEPRRVALLQKAGIWHVYEDSDGEHLTVYITKRSAVEVARLLSPPIDKKTTRTLDFMSERFFERKNGLCWQGIQYSVVVDGVLKRLARRPSIECPGADCTDAVSRVLMFLFTSPKEQAERLRHRLAMSSLMSVYLRQGRLLCSVYQTLFAAEASLFDAYVTRDFMFDRMLETLQEPSFACSYCLESAAYFLLLLLDGARLRRCRSVASNDTRAVLTKATDLFLSREAKGARPDGSRVRAHLREAQPTFGEKDWLSLERLHTA